MFLSLGKGSGFTTKHLFFPQHVEKVSFEPKAVIHPPFNCV